MNIQHIIFASLALSFSACTQAPQSPAPSLANIQNAESSQNNIMSPHLIQITSQISFDDTVAKLRAGITKRPLKLFAEVNHSAGAESIDLALPPSTLFIFGNPKGGTPLMIRNPKMGIVLPLKMHVYQEGETVYISYPDITAVAETYGLDTSKPPVPNISEMLKGLAEEISK